MSIANDEQFKEALMRLDPVQQRQLAARLTENVLSLCRDPRVVGAVSAAKRPDITEPELAAMFQAAKSASVESFTRCGHETDWLAQAGHFVSKAAMACVQPSGAGVNPAWDAAMDARMARTCEAIAAGAGTENREAEAQYRILDEFLKDKAT